jgi:hypothetical protein
MTIFRALALCAGRTADSIVFTPLALVLTWPPTNLAPVWLDPVKEV